MEGVGVNEMVEEVASLSKTISDYGVVIVLVAVALVIVLGIVMVFLFQYNKSMNSNKEESSTQLATILESNKAYMERMLDQNQQLVTTLLSISKVNQPRQEPNQVATQDRRVEQILNLGRDRVKAARVDVFIFTNGTRSYDHKKSFLRYTHSYGSMTTECTLQPLREGPLSLFPSFFEDLLQQKEIFVVDTSSHVCDDPMVTGWLEGAGKAISIGILKEQEYPIGFITAAYESAQDLTDYQKDFHDMAIKVSVLLEGNDI